MKKEEVESTLKIILVDLFNIEESLIKDDSNFVKDFQADSLDIIEFIMEVEDKFNISINDKEEDLIVTFKSFVNLVENKVG